MIVERGATVRRRPFFMRERSHRKAAEWRAGLLIEFDDRLVLDGVKRMVLTMSARIFNFSWHEFF